MADLLEKNNALDGWVLELLEKNSVLDRMVGRLNY